MASAATAPATIVKCRDSLFTTSSGYTNYRGILNLTIILLVLSNARAALENIIKYGILVDPLSWLLFFGEGSKHWPALQIGLCLGVHILVSLLIEKLIAHLFHLSSLSAAKGGTKRASHLSSTLVVADTAIVTNLFACISLPPIVIYSQDTHPISTSGSLMLVAVVFLKLVSYHMMNFWCRDLQRAEELQSRTTKSFLRTYTPPAVEFGLVERAANGAGGGQCPPTPPQSSPSPSPPPRSSLKDTSDKSAAKSNELRVRRQTSNQTNESSPGDGRSDQVTLRILSRYPKNVSLADMVAFMLFPTLNYELDFARTERIRKRFLIKRVVELLILSQLDVALVQQWIVPTVSNSMLPFRQMQFSHMLERLLKLAVPNHVIWLIWFYLFFHSLLNIAAELTRFADREFYRDWWNSESVYYFWSNWNIPVHKWCARHLYVPLLSLGLNKCQASTAVFFVSAFFHEYLVSVPLKMFRMWAFTGMLIQLPWARFVSAYFNNQFANVAVWVSLIIGQPLCILMYYHDYYVINIKTPVEAP